MTVAPAGRRAVFLDRDGVLNHNVFYSDTQAWEAPRLRSDFVPADGAAEALTSLRDAGFLLFLVSNQPNAVNGKSPPGEPDAIHKRLVRHLAAAGITLDGAFYCRHHPAYTGRCACRKPSPHFLLEAARRHKLNLLACWMIGDRATDMACGRAARVRTAWIDTGLEQQSPAAGLYNLAGPDLRQVAAAILNHRG